MKATPGMIAAATRDVILRQVREALGPYNDPDVPAIECIRELVKLVKSQ